MKKKNVFIKNIIIIIFSILFISFIYIRFMNNETKLEITLLNCIDGDTAKFLINGKTEKVRFLGINTPESTNYVEEYGREASEYTFNKLKNATKIYIEYDIYSDKYDKYGRTLGWIFVDNNNLSELLLEEGYAKVEYIYDDYKYVDNLCVAQKKAYKNKLGLWNKNNNYKDNYCFKN